MFKKPKYNNNKPAEESLSSYRERFLGACAENDIFIIYQSLQTIDESLHDQIIEFDNYKGFRIALAKGNVKVLSMLAGMVQDTKKRDEMIHIQDDYAFHLAVSEKDWYETTELLKCMSDLQKRDNLIRKYKKEIFFMSVRYEDHQNVKMLFELITDQEERNEMFVDGEVFSEICFLGDLKLFNRLIEVITDPTAREFMIHHDNELAFCCAVDADTRPIIDRLIELTPDQNKLFNMIMTINEQDETMEEKRTCFNYIIKNDHMDIATKLIKNSPSRERCEELIHADEDYFFLYAVKQGYTSIVNLLLELTPDPAKREAMIHANGDKAFCEAISNGHMNMANLLLELTPDPAKREAMIHANEDKALCEAISKGRVNMVNLLLELTPDPVKRDAMIHADNNWAFRRSAINGKLYLLNRLIELTPDPEKRMAMIHSEGDTAFYEASLYENLNIVVRLIELLSGQIMYNNASQLCISSMKKVMDMQNLDIIQCWLSCMPKLKPLIISYTSYIGIPSFRQKIEDSDNFVQLLSNAIQRKIEPGVMKIFDCLKYGKSIKDFAITGKAFITELENLGLLEVLVDYLGDQNVTLSSAEKVKIIKTLATYSPLNENSNGVGPNGITLLIVAKNPQDKKVSFVERVLAQKAASQEISLRSLA